MTRWLARPAVKPRAKSTEKLVHMAKHLQRDLDNLQQDILALAGLVEGAIYKAIRALRERDVKAAREVIAVDPQIDTEENHIEEECLKILALHQPVAIDLRRIAAAMMINIDLERMGDLAEEIAERAVHLAGLPRLPIDDGNLQKMTDLTTMMVRQSLDSFVNLSTDQAQVVMRMDDEVDRLNVDIINAVVAAMKRSPDQIDAGLSMFSAVRHLERIADHATNIAEDVIYLAEGEIVRHRPTGNNH
jgi:phosphate transport system protein